MGTGKNTYGMVDEGGAEGGSVYGGSGPLDGRKRVGDIFLERNERNGWYF